MAQSAHRALDDRLDARHRRLALLGHDPAKRRRQQRVVVELVELLVIRRGIIFGIELRFCGVRQPPRPRVKCNPISSVLKAWPPIVAALTDVHSIGFGDASAKDIECSNASPCQNSISNRIKLVVRRPDSAAAHMCFGVLYLVSGCRKQRRRRRRIGSSGNRKTYLHTTDGG